MLNLVVGGEQAGEGYEPARVRRLILLVEPQLVAQDFRARRAFLLVGFAEFPDYLAYAVVYLAHAAEHAVLVDAHQLLLPGRVGAHVVDAELGVHEFSQHGFRPYVGVLVVGYQLCGLLALLGGLLHVAAHLDVYLVYGAVRAPDVAHGAERFGHHLLHYRVAQRVLFEVPEVFVNVVGRAPLDYLLGLGVAVVDYVAGLPQRQSAEVLHTCHAPGYLPCLVAYAFVVFSVD